MRKKTPAQIAEEAMIAAEIAKAEMFSASIRLGQFDKRTRYFADDDIRIAYREACEAKAEMDAASQFGRQAMVYAINSLGSFPVDDDLAQLAGLI